MPSTVPNRPTKGATEPTVARMFSFAASRSVSAADRAVHGDREPGAGAVLVQMLAVGGAPPFGNSGGEDPGGGKIAPPARLVEAVDVPGFPEVALEPVVLAIDPAHLRPVAGDDRPGPDRGEQQQHHDDLHGQIGMQEQTGQPTQAILA